MPLTSQDISSLLKLIGEEFETRISPFRDELREFRSEVQQSFDVLFQRDEKREQEYLAIREQVERIEKRIA